MWDYSQSKCSCRKLKQSASICNDNFIIIDPHQEKIYFKVWPPEYPFKNVFDFTTAGDWDCVAAIERLPALHYSVNYIFLSFGIMGFIVELWNYSRVTDEALIAKTS